METTNFYCAIEKIPFTPKCSKQCDNCNIAESLPKQATLEEVASDIQNQCHSFVESVISSKISYRDATDIFLFMKLAELTIKLKQYEK